MKAIIKITLGMIVALSSMGATKAAGSESYSIPLSSYTKPIKDKDKDQRRAPGRDILCLLSKTGGVDFNGAVETITLYEIWDDNGDICLGSYNYESDFIEELFSLEGEYQLRFITDNLTLVGYVCL